MLFEIPPTLQEVFCWRAGQHVTLRFFVEGEEERRSYSISEMPAAGGRLRITVKRVRGGLISNYINERVAPGGHHRGDAAFRWLLLGPKLP